MANKPAGTVSLSTGSRRTWPLIASALSGVLAVAAIWIALYLAGVPTQVRLSASGKYLDPIMIVAFLSFAVVCAFRALDGRLSIPQGQKHNRWSASASAIILWALCFAVLSFFASVSIFLQKAPSAPRPAAAAILKPAKPAAMGIPKDLPKR